MLPLIILIQVVMAHCFDINETNRIKTNSDDYKDLRSPRCSNFNADSVVKLENFAKNTLNFLEKSDKFGEYLKYYNVSDCVRSGSGNTEYKSKHKSDGFLIHEDVSSWHWDEYKSTYDKVYRSWNHELAALRTWLDNFQRVTEHNREYLAGKQSYSLQLNLFGDWPLTSYINRLLKLIKTVPLYDPSHDPHRTAYMSKIHHRVPRAVSESKAIILLGSGLPDNNIVVITDIRGDCYLKVDWRSKGFNPRREEQWQCGACYAFAVAHALQGQLYKTHRMWGELSPQQIVDCSGRDGNLGCDGGSLEGALRYASRAGLTMESEYPYIGKKGLCRYSSFYKSVRPRRWATLPSGDEEAIERALAFIGPLAVAVNAAPFTFQLYRSGIYDDPFCTPWELNHAMLLVGYTEDYWVLLNWWGRQWGENGYIRIRRGFNRCGVANMATYVEL